jgi:Domain of unknown function (DUF4402)
MGTSLRIAAGAALLCGMLSAAPALAASGSARGKGVVLRPLSLVNTGDLQFGSLIRGTTAGTVIIDPVTDARTTTGGVTAAGGAPQAARFVTFGGPLQTLQINRGALPVLNRVGGGGTMNVTQLTLDGPTLRFLNAAGVVNLKVGGTLAVAANQAEGVYAGTFTIIVTYF